MEGIWWRVAGGGWLFVKVNENRKAESEKQKEG
jgi:hypothetical protein